MARAGAAVRRRARAQTVQFLRENALVLSLLLVVVILCWIFVAVLGSWLIQPHWEPYFQGAWAATCVCILHMFVSETDGTYGMRQGAEAEEHTSSELRKLRRHGWYVLDNLGFERFDVDHVAVGPAGVLAVETKWTSLGWKVNPSGLQGPYKDPVHQARRGAAHIEQVLRENGVFHTVWRTIVVWGRKMEELEHGGDWVDPQDGRQKVLVLNGRQSGEWVDRLRQRASLPPAEVEAVREVLQRLSVTPSG